MPKEQRQAEAAAAKKAAAAEALKVTGAVMLEGSPYLLHRL